MKRVNMREIKEVLRLKFDLKLSNSKIALAVNISETTVERYLHRVKKHKIPWPLTTDVTNDQLEALLYPAIEEPSERYTMPDFQYIHKEFKKKGVTLQLLWEEYSSTLGGYSYSQFCNLYSLWRKCDETWMIQLHKAGVNTFIDYAGLTIPIFNPKTGDVAYNAQVFVSVLGASSYIFCEATKSQTIEDWIGSHKRMNIFFGGTTECWVPDNLRTGVTQADRYEPNINQTYLNLSQHYGVAIVPARVRRPQDKSKAESGVYLVETQILARLRNHKFFDLEEANKAIKELLDSVNKKPFQKMPGSSRYSLYLELEKPALQAIPEIPFELFHWGTHKINPGYHVIITEVPYSVPSTFVGKVVEYKYNERTVEFFCKGRSIATHTRSYEPGIPVTNNNHRPAKHQYQAECTPEEIQKQALGIGAPTLTWVEHVLENPSLHIKLRINIALGVVRLSKKYTNDRLNAACSRGLFYSNFTRKGIKDILERELDKQALPQKEIIKPLPQQHSNVRGFAYYQ
jgi:transposase